MATRSATDRMQTLCEGEDARVAEVASFFARSSLEEVRQLCQRMAEDEATFARLVSVVRSLAERIEDTAECESFVARAQRLDCRGETDAALDLLYDGFDELFHAGQMDAAERILASSVPASLNDSLLVGVLTATLPAKSRLPARTAFYKQAERLLTERGSMQPGLLAGLEP